MRSLPWIVRTDVGRVVGELRREFRRGEGRPYPARPDWAFEFVKLERPTPNPGQEREVVVRLDWKYHDVYVKRVTDLVGVPGYVHDA